jgi:hypothetical protein
MTIVGYGYGLNAVPNVFVDDIQMSLDADPDIVLDPDVDITLEEDGVDISVDPDIDIEVD